MDISATVKKIIGEVRRRGDAAVSFYTGKYDGVALAPEKFAVSAKEISDGSARVSDDVKKSIAFAAARIRAYARRRVKSLRRRDIFVNADGVSVGEILTPVGTAALYVPGGRYPYPSTVMMTAVPAAAAGVRRIFIMTPPGNVTPELLYAARICGVKEIYRVGGVQAISAAAYGTRTIPRADIIVGPGNKFVTEAKRQVFGDVGIDGLAGPSEVAVIADKYAPAKWVAADLAAQAEHDPSAKCYLFAPSRSFAGKVLKLVPGNFARRIIVKVSSPDAAAAAVSAIAPEHLEIMVRRPAPLVGKIKNAGAIFVGYMTPTALGDYCAGPSHVLPTGGAARFSGGLSVETFLKKISVVSAPRGKKSAVWTDIAARLADAEGLSHHAASARLRKGK